MHPKRRRRNPTNGRRATSALGLGLGVTGLGLALADIYQRPSIAYVAAGVGVGMTLFHWPWSRNDPDA